MYKKTLIIVAIAAIVLSGCTQQPESDNERMKGVAHDAIDLIGTESSPSEFYTSDQASTTIFISANADLVDIDIYAPLASSSVGHLQLNLEKSNDVGCNDSDDGTIVWYDVTPQTSTSNNVITMQTALTQWSWIPGSDGEATTIQITNWNATCLRITASSTSMTLWISMRVKDTQ